MFGRSKNSAPIDMVQPVNPLVARALGLTHLYKCLPGMMSGSRVVNLKNVARSNGGHGTFSGGCTWGAANRNWAAGGWQFDGSTGQILIPAFTFATRHTITFVVTANSITNLDGIIHGTALTGEIRFESGVKYNVGAGGITAPAPTLRVPTHYSFSYDGTNCYAYKDGKPSASGVATSIAGTDGFGWGFNIGFARVLDGSLDDVTIHNRDLSPGEIDWMWRESVFGMPNLLNRVGRSSAFGRSASGGLLLRRRRAAT